MKNDIAKANEPKKGYADSKKTTWAVYEVLKKHSSWEHPLSKATIRVLVKNLYGLDASRNTISDTVERLREFYGEDIICCSETERTKADGEDTYTYAYFYDREAAEDALTDEDISKLVNVCLYARNLHTKEAKELIRQLKGMATADYQKRLDYTEDVPEKQFNTNSKTSENLQMLRELISKNRGRKQNWISFDFNYYSSNDEKKLSFYNRYTVLPLAICEADHKYYLLCAMEGSFTKIYHFRIDLMTKIKQIPHEMMAELEELKKSLDAKDISDYMSTHLHMFYGEPRRMDIEVPKEKGRDDANLTFLTDAFGTGATWRVKSESKDAVVVSIRCVPRAMKVLLMQYAGKGLRVVGPEDVKKEIDDMIREDCERIMKG